MNQKKSLANSLSNIFTGVEMLRHIFPEKKFTFDGRLVGDIGEAITARNYDVNLSHIVRPLSEGVSR